MISLSKIIVDIGPGLLMAFFGICTALFGVWHFTPAEGEDLVLIRLTILGIVVAFMVVIMFQAIF